MGHKWGKKPTGCSLPKMIRTKRGSRCVRICDGSRWQFLPGSECAKAAAGRHGK